MDFVQQGNARLDPKRRFAKNTVGVSVILGIGLSAAIIGGMLVVNAAGKVGPGASLGDSLVQPAAIVFREAERAVGGASAIRSATQPAAIEFRRTEHEATGTSAGDVLTQPAAIEFRRSEHEASH